VAANTAGQKVTSVFARAYSTPKFAKVVGWHTCEKQADSM
jgi:hypothetical protein